MTSLLLRLTLPTQKVLEKELKHWTQRDEDLRLQVVSSPDKLMAVSGFNTCIVLSSVATVPLTLLQASAQLESQVKESRVTNDETNGLLIKWESIVSNAHSVPPVC